MSNEKRIGGLVFIIVLMIATAALMTQELQTVFKIKTKMFPGTTYVTDYRTWQNSSITSAYADFTVVSESMHPYSGRVDPEKHRIPDPDGPAKIYFTTDSIMTGIETFFWADVFTRLIAIQIALIVAIEFLTAFTWNMRMFLRNRKS